MLNGLIISFQLAKVGFAALMVVTIHCTHLSSGNYTSPNSVKCLLVNLHVVCVCVQIIVVPVSTFYYSFSSSSGTMTL